ncbi:MAG TPA: hypothetical protein VGV87_01705 [Blastocatellia bacterium]|jgi:hypothetical protein|nr:hypothetical protein [Blastocatellia bacterium]
MKKVRLAIRLIGYIATLSLSFSVARESALLTHARSVSPEANEGGGSTSNLGHIRQEQSVFGLEIDIDHPVSIPKDVLRILKTDRAIRKCFHEDEAAREVTPSMFVAAEIDLNYDNIPDLVVTAADTCLMGANIGPFWVFRKTDHGYERILRVDTLNLEFLKTKTNCYRNVQTTGATAREAVTTTYIFNGRVYQLRRSKTEPIR